MNRFLQKFLSARFLVVLLTTITFCYLATKGELTTEFSTMYAVIVNYYFYKERSDKDKKR